MFCINRLLSSRVTHIRNARKASTKTQRKVLQFSFPDKLLNTKHKTPSHMYIADERAAEIIHTSFKPFLRQSLCNTAVELNPGICLLTNKLLEEEDQFKKIVLIEAMDYFLPQLNALSALHPKRLVVKSGDFVNISKLAFQDKMDNGTRVADLLEDMPKRSYKDAPCMQVFGAVGSYKFFKHLINALTFQTSLFLNGRSEFYLVVPPPIFIHLTCTDEIGYLLYRSASILFQILFEYRFITQIPREYFIPAQSGYKHTKSSKLGKIRSINPEYLYLVKIEPRRNLFELCPAEDLPALWYFIKQNCVSRRNRVIPNMEKWVPGCGPRLIINSRKFEPVQPLYPDEDVKSLPKFSTPCTTMNCNNFFQNMNIYTQFGDLTPSQMLSLFTQFRRWPEYTHSSFLASLESSLIKMETSADENVDGIAEEDDDGSGASSASEVLVDVETKKKKPKRRKKTEFDI